LSWQLVLNSVAITNASTVVCFFRDMQLFNVTLHQNYKLDSLRLGLIFEIENLVIKESERLIREI